MNGHYRPKVDERSFVLSRRSDFIRRVVISFLLLVQQTALGCYKLTEHDQPAVFCQSSVKILPLSAHELPINIAKLRIIGSSLPHAHTGKLMFFNLTGLHTLTYLEISDFNLHVIETGTFTSMHRLTVLDLSNNNIEAIQPGAFRGLNLNLLSLSSNPGIAFSPGSFQGSTIHHFAARSCSFEQLEYESIAVAQPRQLSLSDNRLTYLDARFGQLIRPYQTDGIWGYVDLSENPLTCDCRLKWLIESIEQQLYENGQHYIAAGDAVEDKLVIQPEQRLMYSMNMTCAEPRRFRNQALPRPWQILCPKPEVIGVNIDLPSASSDVLQLTCIGRGRPAPSLSWTYTLHGQKVQRILEPSTSRESGSSSLDNSIRESEHGKLFLNVEQHFTINVSLSEQENNFFCTAWNDDNLHPDQFVSSAEAISRSAAYLDELKSHSNYSSRSRFNDGGAISYYRWHEVSVRVKAPKSSSAALLSASTGDYAEHDASSRAIENESASVSPRVNANLKQGFLFAKRYSLLELMGAILGTFLATIIIIFTIKRLVATLCPTSYTNRKRLKWFHLESTKGVSNMVPQLPTNHTLPGRSRDSIINHRQIPQAISQSPLDVRNAFQSTSYNLQTTSNPLSRIPLPRSLIKFPQQSLERTITPPPNPVYWQDYVYTADGHEYDVPRSIDLHRETLRSIYSTQSILLSQDQPNNPGQLIDIPTLQRQGNLSAGIHPQLNRSAFDNSLRWATPTPLQALASYGHNPSQIMALSSEEYPAYLSARPFPHYGYATELVPNTQPNSSMPMKHSALSQMIEIDCEQDTGSSRPSRVNTLSNHTNSTNGSV